MDESFDPYRKWLGIPPEEQPPHHYRLLGLELFEADADVIVNAADARMSFLRTLSSDKHSDMAERIVVQIKEAQSCLFDPAKKAFYDGQLKRRIAALNREPPATPTTPIVTASSSVASSTADIALPKLQIPSPSKLSARSRREQWPKVAAGFLGLAAIVCLLVFLIGKSGNTGGTPSSMPVAQSVPENGNNHGTKPVSIAPRIDSPAGEQTTKSPHPSGNGEKDPPPKIGGTSTEPPKPKGDNPAHVPKNNPFDVPNNEDKNHSEDVNPGNILGMPDEDLPPSNPPKNSEGDSGTAEKSNSTEGSGRDNPPPRRPAGMRQPIPEESARQAAEKNVREIYGVKIAAAKSGKDKRLLADQIRRQAADAKDDSAGRYGAMSIAFQLIGESGQLQRALLYADSFARYFEVDPWELKADAVAKSVQAARNNLSEVNGDDLVLICKDLAEEAKQTGQIEIAGKIVKAAIPLAKKDQVLLTNLNKLGREIERLKARYQPVRKALETLKDKPDDADANAVAGRWTCFESREWEKGLPMLAKSSDAALAKLADKDLAAPEGANRRMEIADIWWDLAQKEKDESASKPGMLDRAEYWYRRSLPDLNGLNKTKAETRLKTIAGGETEAAPGKGVIKAGNVALAKNGTTVQGVRTNADKLFDGDSENPGWDGGAANSPVPCEWTITLDKVYQLREIRFHFYNGDQRFYHYTLAVSADGVNYKTIAEHNQGQWYGWQIIPFSARPVKSIKIYGTFSYNKKVFSVTEFEAYCIPPKQ